jgi:tetratricopeptide (TPR) repeat protein
VNAEEYLTRGNELFNQENFDGAISEYTEALKIEPNNETAKKNLSVAYYSRGIASYHNGDSKKAIEDIEEALKHNPNDAIFYGALGYIYYDTKENPTMVALDSSIDNYSKHIKFYLATKEINYYRGHSSRASSYYKKSKLYLQAERFDKYLIFTDLAIEDLEIAIQYVPTDDAEIERVELDKKSLELMKSELEDRKSIEEFRNKYL